MVDLTRRKTVIGLGLLATGSGATFTSAGFTSSSASDSDLRVVVEQGLRFGANPDLNPDDRDDLTDNPDLFDAGSSGGLDDSDDGAFGDSDDPASDLPLAFVGGSNDDLQVKTAVPLGEQDISLDELFQIRNNTADPAYVGIIYDRRNGDFDNSDAPSGQGSGQYGADIATDGSGDSNIVPADAQQIYQFRYNSTASSGTSLESPVANPDDIISPSPGEVGIEGDGGDITTGDGNDLNEFDLPTDVVRISPGGSAILDLVVNTAGTAISDGDDLEAKIRDEAEFAGAPVFNSVQRDTVQVIDGLTVVSGDPDFSEYSS
jgi:hypothetical protein